MSEDDRAAKAARVRALMRPPSHLPLADQHGTSRRNLSATTQRPCPRAVSIPRCACASFAPARSLIVVSKYLTPPCQDTPSQHHTTRIEDASSFSSISLQRTTSCVRRPPYVQRARCASGGWSSEERRSPSTATACPAMYTTTAACSPTRVPLCTHHHPLLATIRADRQQQQRRPVSQRSVPSHRVPA